MAIKSKTFDCVESKRLAQRHLREEYETRKSEFDSYADFLNAIVLEDEWTRRNWQRFSAPTA